MSKSTARESAIRFFPMLDAVNKNNLRVVIDFVEDAVSAGTNPVAVFVGKLLDSYGTWIDGKVLDTLSDYQDVLVRQVVEIFLRGGLKNYFVLHVSSCNHSEKCLYLLPALLLRDRICLRSVRSVRPGPDSSSSLPNPLSESGYPSSHGEYSAFSLLSWLYLPDLSINYQS